MADSEVRKRKTKTDESEKKSKVYKTTDVDDETSSNKWLDALRGLTFLLLASCALSYMISSGNSFMWGKRPHYLTVDYWKAQLKGPIYLTPEELAAFDGQDPEKPLYIALNGTIFDVSNGRRIYGPGGSYNWFAGVDAARAFVTGCFAEDRTPDMRGVELMYLPLDDPEVDSHWTAAELEELKAKELEDAHQKVHAALDHWVQFFGKSTKYTKVGYVKRPEGWLEALEPRELCKQAAKGRSKRKVPKK
ncbi:hypothetical protein V2G26_016030 [Clonostachys chloroleuca]|uniref:Cytochrome b5 heme-binding domain-containing protein n=1 Tax=Clonostachys chloroleuca TaxID=1926264 RepID=A0AA35Q7I3_9HYPO|nr:unnamed protein product [Clonostachys chloroleuca]